MSVPALSCPVPSPDTCHVCCPRRFLPCYVLFCPILCSQNDGDVAILGTFRYRSCDSHPFREGLLLEDIVRKKTGHGPAPPPAPSGFSNEAGPGGYSPVSDADSNPGELDKDMTEDVMLLSGMISEGYPTVQADAASVVAGLTSRGERFAEASRLVVLCVLCVLCVLFVCMCIVCMCIVCCVCMCVRFP